MRRTGSRVVKVKKADLIAKIKENKVNNVKEYEKEEEKVDSNPTGSTFTTFTMYNGLAVDLKNTTGTMLNREIKVMTTQALTECENNSKEMVYYNRKDDLIININEMKYLE